MKTEFEAKFINVDINDIRNRLKQNGATLEKPMHEMKRVTIDTPEMKKKDAFVRIRDEGDKTTITYKQFDSLSVDGAKEHEIVVDSFNEAVSLFSAAGLKYGSFQESRRETWVLSGAEVVIDQWPWLNPYIEVEGTSSEHVQQVAEKLGFKWNTALFGDVMAAFRAQYPHLSKNDTIGNLPEVRFEDPLPSLLKP